MKRKMKMSTIRRERTEYLKAAVSGGMCILVSFLLGGTYLTVYSAAIAESLGISRAMFSAAISVRDVVSFLVTISIYKLLKKISIKKIAVTGILVTALSTAGIAVAKSLGIFILVTAIGGMGVSLCGSVTASILVHQWFRKSYGSIFALVMTSSTAGGVILSPIFSRIASQQGWRLAYCGIAILIFLCGILCLILMRSAPEEIGMHAYGAEDEEKTAERVEEERVPIFGKEQESKNLRILLLVGIFYMIGGLSVYSYVAPILQEIGYDPAFATGAAISVVSLAGFLGKLVMGKINDKWGTPHMIRIWYTGLCLAVVYFLLYRGNAIRLAIPGLALVGYSSGIYSTPIPIAVNRLYRSHGKYAYVVGLVNGAITLTGVVSGIIFNGIFDKTGSYRGSLLMATITSMMCLTLMLRFVKENGEQLKR